MAIEPIVADFERPPFADQSVDLVYVHDGLHHLQDQFTGLREMTRVARLAVSLTEPADAIVTRIAMGLGLEHEDARNRVARMKEADIARFF